MAALMFVGDEAAAAAFRLAGVRTLSPRLQDAAPVLRQALHARPDLLLVTAEYAGQLPIAELERALLSLEPLLLLIPDLRARVPMPDLAAQVRRQLGLVA